MSGLVNRTVIWLTFRQLFARKRLWFAAAFAAAPLLFTLGFLLVGNDGAEARAGFFSTLNREIVIGTLLPLTAVIFGTTAFGGEVDDGTLIYLLVKPVPRWQLVLSKYLVAVLSTFAVMIPAVLLPWLLLHDDALPIRLPMAFLTGVLAGALVYCALFLLLGLVTKRALVVGLLYVIGFEGVLTRSMMGLKSLSVREFAIAIAQASSAGTITLPFTVPMTTVWWMGSIMLVGAMAWTMRKLVRYELAERL